MARRWRPPAPDATMIVSCDGLGPILRTLWKSLPRTMDIVLGLALFTFALQAGAVVTAFAIARAPGWRRARILGALALTAGLYSLVDLAGALWSAHGDHERRSTRASTWWSRPRTSRPGSGTRSPTSADRGARCRAGCAGSRSATWRSRRSSRLSGQAVESGALNGWRCPGSASPSPRPALARSGRAAVVRDALDARRRASCEQVRQVRRGVPGAGRDRRGLRLLRALRRRGGGGRGGTARLHLPRGSRVPRPRRAGHRAAAAAVHRRRASPRRPLVATQRRRCGPRRTNATRHATRSQRRSDSPRSGGSPAASATRSTTRCSISRSTSRTFATATSDRRRRGGDRGAGPGVRGVGPDPAHRRWTPRVRTGSAPHARGDRSARRGARRPPRGRAAPASSPEVRPRLDPVPRVLADEGKLVQAVVNALVNSSLAVGHEPGARPSIEVRDLHRRRRGRGDRGAGQRPGIPARPPPEARRALREHAGPAGGTGLGLFVVRGIVEAHGGVLELENARGGGAVLRIILPASARPDAA